MKTILYLIALLFFLLPSGAQWGPVGLYSGKDTIPADTIPGAVKLQTDSALLIRDTLVNRIDSITTVDSFIAIGKPIKGTASYYSAKFEGRKTATGDVFRQSKLTAASNHFKLNTLVMVTNLKNNKSVIVLINDRMHAKMKKKGRVVDLSRTAAKQLDFIQNGLAKVVVQPINPYNEN